MLLLALALAGADMPTTLLLPWKALLAVGPDMGKARHQTHFGGVCPSAIIAVRDVVTCHSHPTHLSSHLHHCQRPLGIVTIVVLASSPALLWHHCSCRCGAGVVTLVALAMSHCGANVVAVITLTLLPLLRQRYCQPIFVSFLFLVLWSYLQTHNQILL
jgi:hypothetical protein